jgi:hypothetical protein
MPTINSKPMKVNFLNFLIIGLCIFTLQQCKPDEPCEGLDTSNQYTYYYFPDTTASQNGMLAHPFDTLTFVSETFDTAIFVLTKVNNSFDQTFKKKYGNPGCPGMIYDYYEYYELVYTNKSLNKLITKYGVQLMSDKKMLEPYVEFNIKNDKNTSFIGWNSLLESLDYKDTLIRIKNNDYIARQFGLLNEGSIFGIYSKVFGLVVYKHNNEIWRRVF